MRPLRKDDSDDSDSITDGEEFVLEVPTDEDYVTRDLEKDTFSGAIVAAVHFANALRSHEKEDVNFYLKNLVAFLLHFGVMASQFFLVVVLAVYMIQPLQRKFHEEDIAAKTVLLQNSIDLNRNLSQSSDPLEQEALQICTGQVSVAWLAKVINFFWLVKMTMEVSDSFWMCFSFVKLPWPQKGQQEITVKDEKDGTVYITHTTRGLWVYFLFLVNGPRLVASVVLGYIGMQFLFFAKTPAMLIMKSLSLAFVVTLDELIFGGLASSVFKKEVGKMKVSYKKQRDHKPEKWNQWGSTVTKCVIIFAILHIYVDVIHANMEHFRRTCSHYKDTFLTQPFSLEDWQF